MKHSRRSRDARDRGGEQMQCLMQAHLAWPPKPNVLSPLDSPRCPKKQIRRVVVLAISVGTSWLPDSLSPPSQQVPAGFCFLSSYDCLSSKRSGDAEPKGLTKIRPDLWSCLQALSRHGHACHTNWQKNQGLQVLSAAVFVSLFAKSCGAAVCAC